MEENDEKFQEDQINEAKQVMQEKEDEEAWPVQPKITDFKRRELEILAKKERDEQMREEGRQKLMNLIGNDFNFDQEADPEEEHNISIAEDPEIVPEGKNK